MDEPLRDWQEQALQQFLAQQPDDFLVVATPAAGKTTYALVLVRTLLKDKFDRVVVVVPTAHLKKQWADSAAALGVNLDPNWTGDRPEARDYDGVVVTYAQVNSQANALVHRNLVGRRPTFVIFDEIHHASDENSWGHTALVAFDGAVNRLTLSGTPFRSDNVKIPFVKYDASFQCVPDFEFKYGDAIRQEVCRPVLFNTFDARVEFLSGDKHYETTFDDPLNEKLESQRLRASLTANQGWITTVLADANRELERIRREEQPDAGGLVIAMNQAHAREIADQIRAISGTPPILAVSEAPDASARIAAFKKSRAPWIVAVKMVSEGVDIPRLRVAVYATNIVSPMFFRQAVGRVVRMQKQLTEDQTAHFYIPADQRLVDYARAIEEEYTYTIRDLLEESATNVNEPDDAELEDELFAPISAEALEGDWLYRSQEFDPALRAEAKAWLGSNDLPVSPTTLLTAATAIRKGMVAGERPPQSQRGARATAKYERKGSLRQTSSFLTSKIARQHGIEHQQVNLELARLFGKVSGVTEAILLKRIEFQQAWLADVNKVQIRKW